MNPDAGTVADGVAQRAEWISAPDTQDATDGGHTEARANAITRAKTYAPFLARLLTLFPDDVARFQGDGAEAALAAVSIPSAGAQADGEGDFASALRRARGRVALLTALGDLSGQVPLFRVTRVLSDFADAAVDAALAAALAERMPGEEPRGLAVIALGKLGSHELNYSSDIDPILLFDPVTFPHRSRDDPGEAAVRVARRMTELLSARTADGHVLRVDLRLRPSPEVTPIVLPVESAITYYESQALAWEQAAFIRSRASSGDRALGAYFLQAIQPFVWRRSVDFRQIKEVGALSERIRSHYAQGQAFGPGYDLKRGRGGIRECEFYAQIHQLIFAGRESDLRTPATTDALGALAQAGRIDADVAADLTQAYALYRRIEHRLQMIDDQQTHTLPTAPDALDAVARLDGLAEGAALLELLRPHVERVGTHYDTLVQQDAASQALPHDAVSLDHALQAAGLDDAGRAQLAATITAWRSGDVRILRSAAARDALEAVLPALVTAFARAPDPAAVTVAFDHIVAGLPSAINFFHLLAARPALIDLIVRVLVHAPALADALATRSGLIEGLIDARAFAPPQSCEEYEAELRAGPPRDYETTLDHVRQLVGEWRFALGVQLIEGLCDPLVVARGYADVAEAALRVLTKATEAEFADKHGRVPDSRLIILALGRFGGQALTHASDLDLIMLFTGDHRAVSDGMRPLEATHYYNRLAQRVTAALSVPTAAGRLYDVDTRLRPSGAQGPLVVSVESFLRYQADDAWFWEHMALTRARVVWGPDADRVALAQAMGAIVAKPRDAAEAVAAARTMRRDIATHKPPSGPFDVKLIDGGLVDAEFAIQTLQMVHGLTLSTQLDDALGQLIEKGLAPPAMQDHVRLLSRMLIMLRLVAPNGDAPRAVSHARVAYACQARDWDDLMTRYDAARDAIRAWWADVAQEGA